MTHELRLLGRILRLTFGPRRFGWRRAVFVGAFLAIGLLMTLANALGRALDPLHAPGYRQVDVGRPIFIVAPPRSGTTLLHRLMSLDPRLTSLALWQTLFPSLTAYRLQAGLRALDRGLGRPLERIQAALAERVFRVWKGVHRTRFSEPEEDEAIFVLRLATPSVWMGVPFPGDLPEVATPDRGPRAGSLARSWAGTVRRHLFSERGRTLLAKNVLLAGRLDIVRAVAPEARFIHIERDPLESLPSALGFFTAPWRIHSPDLPLDGPEARAFAEQCMTDMLRLHHFIQSLPPERVIRVRYEDLVEDPGREIRRIHAHFDLSTAPEFFVRLRREIDLARQYRPTPRPALATFGLSEAEVRERLAEIFERAPEDDRASA